MQFELVATDGSGKPARIVDEAEAKRLLMEQYKHTDFLEGLRRGQLASVEGGMLRLAKPSLGMYDVPLPHKPYA